MIGFYILILSILGVLILLCFYSIHIVNDDLRRYDKKEEERWKECPIPVKPKEEYINTIDDLYL